MAEPKKKRKKSKGKAPRAVRLTERAFTPEADTLTRVSQAAGAVGAALLGAGVYAQFLRETPHKQGSFILAGGALLLAAVILLFPDRAPLLVGDLGVGEDKGPDATKRLAWCDVESIVRTASGIVVKGKEASVDVPLPSHACAAAWIVAEAEERRPDVLDIGDRADLPKPADDDGELRELSQPQLAGRRCKASGRVISYEPDARLCTRCGQVYHRESVPAECLTCGGTEFSAPAGEEEEEGLTPAGESAPGSSSRPNRGNAPWRSDRLRRSRS